MSLVLLIFLFLRGGGRLPQFFLLHILWCLKSLCCGWWLRVNLVIAFGKALAKPLRSQTIRIILLHNAYIMWSIQYCLVNCKHRFQFEIPIPNSMFQFKIPIQNSNLKFQFKIPIQNSNSKFEFRIPIRNSNSKFQFQIPIQNSNSKL